jgi:hypothetical protein
VNVTRSDEVPSVQTIGTHVEARLVETELACLEDADRADA